MARDLGISSATVERVEELMAKAPELVEQVAALPPGTYRVLYADPPWAYNSGKRGLDQYGPAERHYPTLEEDVIEVNRLVKAGSHRGSRPFSNE